MAITLTEKKEYTEEDNLRDFTTAIDNLSDKAYDALALSADRENKSVEQMAYDIIKAHILKTPAI